MERLLNALERRFGRYSLDNLTLLLVGAQAAVLVLSLARPTFADLLLLDPAAVRAGQYWRLFTYLFVPVSFSPFWALFALYWLYIMGSALENEWGSFKYQLYWLVGVVVTAGYAFAFDVPATNQYLIMSLFLAFATLFPRYQILVFFILPMQVRWLALLDVALLALAIWQSYGWERLIPLLAVANYLLFFGEQLWALARRQPYQPGRSRASKTFAKRASEPPKVRRCAMCGLTSEDDPNMDFRVCTCEKHDGPTELCLPHARNH